MNETDRNLKAEHLRNKFRKLYPEYDHILSRAKTDDEISRIREQIVLEQKKKIEKSLKERGIKSNLKEAEEGLAIQLRPEKYQELIEARGSNIETKLLVLLDEFSRMKDLDDKSGEKFIYMLAQGGLLMATAYAIKSLFTQVCNCAAEEMAAVLLEGVEVIGVRNIVGIVVCVILDILIPLIYFIRKPAVCILCLINELHQDLIFVEEKCIHGKRSEITTMIPKVANGESGTYYSAGFFASEKKENALIGTQYGFVVRQADIDKVKFSFGMGCPLAEGKNNCAVSFDQTAESIACDADKYQKQEDIRANQDYKLEIRCNSSGGSVAYYIGRVTYA